MNATIIEILRLGAKGLCCSQIMVQMGLEKKGDDIPELVDAVAGLCGGLHSGLCCGILTGACCLLSMCDKANAKSTMIPRLVEWFQKTYTPQYGDITCKAIVGDSLAHRMERCPRMMAETYDKCRELLAEFGHEI